MAILKVICQMCAKVGKVDTHEKNKGKRWEWIKRMKEKHQCEEKVRESGRWPHYHPCIFNATINRDGKWYCKKHDPVTIKEKREWAMRLYNESREREHRIRLRERAMEHYCENLTTEYMETHQAMN